MDYPIVVKIGGSLLDCLDPILDAIKRDRGPLLIVPGGGKFAELVRETGLSGDEAHWMAIAAMEQMGWYIASKGVSSAIELKTPCHAEVLLPYTLLRTRDPLPHSWDVTSDTIAAWVASSLSLPLVLLKSVDGIRIGGIVQERVTEDIQTPDVDPSFLRFVLATGVHTTVINGRVQGRLERFLQGRKVPGTTIGF